MKRLAHIQDKYIGQSPHTLSCEGTIMRAVCSHPHVWSAKCVKCGERVETPVTTTASAWAKKTRTVRVPGGVPLEMTEESHRELRIGHRDRLLASRRLALILDLDHTLIHANPVMNAETLGEPTTPTSFVVDTESFWCRVKTRPGLAEFLERASELFDLEIYTAGTRRYALAVAEKLDPDRKYFRDRIVARCDSPHPFKELCWIHNVGPDMTLIIDDRDDVWPGAKNVVTIQPFLSFGSGREVHNEPGCAFVEVVDARAEEARPYLLDVLEFVEGIHRRFYSLSLAEQRSASVVRLFHGSRRDICKGVVVVFSHVFTLGTDVESTPLYARVRQYGMVVGSEVDDHTTHVVAARPGTEKVKAGWARKTVHVVTIGWLLETMRRYRRQPEDRFALPKPPAPPSLKRRREVVA